MRNWLLLCVVFIVSGCGDTKEPAPAAPPPKPANAPASAPATSPVSALGNAALPASKEAILAEVRKKQLVDDDFIETDTNRDPFRPFLASFAVQTPLTGKQHKIILQKFSLDEIKLSAIVLGEDLSPKAMFIDPSGMGILIARGDHVSKSDALVVRVAPDRVFFRIDEDVGGGKIKSSERVIELHAGEVITNE